MESVVEELAYKRLGRTIKGKWRLDRLIGVGGMAAVYAATHRNGARVAIKMLHPTISASQQIRARFVREGYLANKVEHPGVVRVLDDDVDDTDQAAFLVMDLVIGTTLSERAMARLLDDGEVLDVAAQVLEVLAAAHDKGIVHRDLKPDNLLVDVRGKVHVLDFGIARLLENDGLVSATKTGTAFGTPGFMAPEQAMGRTRHISARTDIYALGATLFALVTGDFVHAAENPQELLVLVATEPPRSLASLAPQMSADVIKLIDCATRKAPEDRWQSAGEMLAEVRRIQKEQHLEGRPVLPLSPVEALLTPAPGMSPWGRTSSPRPSPEPEPPRRSLPTPEPADPRAIPRPDTDATVVAPPPLHMTTGPSLASTRDSIPEEGNGVSSSQPVVPRRRLSPAVIITGLVVIIGTAAAVLAAARTRSSTADAGPVAASVQGTSLAGAETTPSAPPSTPAADPAPTPTPSGAATAVSPPPAPASVAPPARTPPVVTRSPPTSRPFVKPPAVSTRPRPPPAASGSIVKPIDDVGY